MIEITSVNEDGIWFSLLGVDYVGRYIPEFEMTVFINTEDNDIAEYAPGEPESFTEAELRQVFNSIISAVEIH